MPAENKPAAPELPASALPPDAAAGYVEQMVGKADGQTPTPPADKPQLLAGKFKTPEDLVKAYAELEKKLGERANEKPADAAGNEAQAGKGEGEKPADPTKSGLDIPDKAAADAAKQAVENAGLSFDSFSQEFAEKGALSDDSFAKLEKAGIPRAVVQQFIDGQIAVAERQRAEVHQIVGGQDGYAAMTEWAAQNLAPNEIAAYNNVVNGRDLAAVKLAVQGLHARFTAANGSEPSLVGGNAPTGDVYRNAHEVRRDMADPRYERDPAFRAEVQQKLFRSNVDF